MPIFKTVTNSQPNRQQAMFNRNPITRFIRHMLAIVFLFADIVRTYGYREAYAVFVVIRILRAHEQEEALKRPVTSDLPTPDPTCRVHTFSSFSLASGTLNRSYA